MSIVGMTSHPNAGRIELDEPAALYRAFTPFTMRNTMASIPGREWDKKRGHWTYPATGACAYKLARAFKCEFALKEENGEPVATIKSPTGVDLCGDLMQRAARFHLAQAILRGDVTPSIPEVKTKPREHQKMGLMMARYLDGFYLAWDMGTGKTKTGIDVAEFITEATRTLVICPAKVINNWPGQWVTHGTRRVRVLPLENALISDRAKAIESYLAMRVPFVAVVNYEVIWRSPLEELLLSTTWDLVIADEIHRAKDPDGKASKTLERLQPKAKKRMALSGTPIPNNPLDLFAQLRFVDPGLLGSSYHAFKAKYAIKGGYGAKQVVGFRNLEELNRQFYMVAHKVSRFEVLDLPPFTHTFEMIKLEPKAKKLYDEISSDFYTEVDGGKITVENALTEILRLQQITGGGLGDDDKNIHVVSTAKRDYLADRLQDLPKDESVVVFCKFRHDLDAIHEAAKASGRASEELSGRIRGELPEGVSFVTWAINQGVKTTKWGPPHPGMILAVQIQSGGVGVDFTAAARAFYYSQTHNNGDYEQSLARIHRDGQLLPCFYHHLICEGTIDVKVYKALSKKTSVASLVLEEHRSGAGDQDFGAAMEELSKPADLTRIHQEDALAMAFGKTRIKEEPPRPPLRPIEGGGYAQIFDDKPVLDDDGDDVSGWSSDDPETRRIKL
jgi:SNF2 family DNA or RNA helicase